MNSDNDNHLWAIFENKLPVYHVTVYTYSQYSEATLRYFSPYKVIIFDKIELTTYDAGVMARLLESLYYDLRGLLYGER